MPRQVNSGVLLRRHPGVLTCRHLAGELPHLVLKVGNELAELRIVIELGLETLGDRTAGVGLPRLVTAGNFELAAAAAESV